MRFYAYHGLFPEENTLGQQFEVDVEILGAFEGWAEHGENPDFTKVEGAVNYPEVYDLVNGIVTGERFGLVESLADRLITSIQDTFGVNRLIVRVRKPNPPVPAQFDGIEVEVSRGLD